MKHCTIEKTITDFLLNQADERIIVLNPNFEILEANDAFLKAVSMSRSEAIGKHCYEITHGLVSPCSEWHPEKGCPLIETLRSGQSAHVIHEHHLPEEGMTYCDLETYPIKNAQGQVARVIEIWRDITEELTSRFEVRLKELKENFGKIIQEDRLISLGKLSASCVHEINNPIQGLLTLSRLMETILDAGDPSKEDIIQFKEHLFLMTNELERCGNIISGLLSFARESVMDIKKVDLNEVIEMVIGLTRHKMQLQDIEVKMELYKKPLEVNGDMRQLQQCFLDLIFNSIEAMPHGGSFNVFSKPNSKKESAQVIFQDSGCGINKENLDHIFEPFFTTKEEGSGTGLGLAIVYGIVKSHDGNIEVKSEEGKGTSFIINFPI